MRTLNVPLPDDATERLRELAQREFRGPREQASWLILDGLRRAGLDVDKSTPRRARRQAAASEVAR